MSWQAVEWSVKRVPPKLVCVPARAVLTAFAEAADEHGRNAYPSLPTVAWYLDCSVRNVEKHVAALLNAGLMVRSKDQSAAAHIPADRRPTVYELPISWVRTDEKPEAKRRGRKPRASSDGQNSSSPRLENDPNSSAIRPELQYVNDPNSSAIRPELQIGETALESSNKPPKNRVRTSAPTRGSRISEDFTPRTEDVEWARDTHPNVDLTNATEKFVNYWLAKTGSNATKLDWNRTWRNWVINESERYGSRTSTSKSSSSSMWSADNVISLVEGMENSTTPSRHKEISA